MNKILIVGATTLALVSTASAADLPARTYTKAPPIIAPAPTNWSGFYLGGFGGYGWAEKLSADVFGAGTFTSSNMDGGFGGGTIGYNWQFPGSQFVGGLEVDAAGSGLKSSQTILALTGTDKLEAFGTVTGRLGVAFDTVLLYAKGGYAWGSNKFTVDTPFFSYSQSKVHSGWTVGGGLEWMFAPQWSAKVEYQYLDLGKENYLSAALPPGVDVKASFHTVKAGVNYHFNWGGPVVAKY